VGAFFVGKLFDLLITMLGVSSLTFVMLRMTGDPVTMILPPEASAQQVAETRKALGLDVPLPEQYGRFLLGAVRGDFGDSFRYREPAINLVARSLWPTLQLATLSILVAVLLGVPMGILAARHRNTLIDKAVMAVSLIGQSMPFFWLGIMLIILFAVRLRWVPTSGSGTPAHLVLPVVTMGAYALARIARLTRSSMLDVLGQDYVRTARAKGLTERLILARHALRNAAIPVLTMIGLHFGLLMGGAVVVETIFAWPGLGRLIITSIYLRDYPVVQAGVLYMALVFVVINGLLDVSYWLIDPTVKQR
jgi:ABC-type dipeptide/oligopeptide/nickel transport system permease component